ncbi:nucleoside diphosphate kinase regulator [Solilutibacter oculi]|uniref:nucleoside diphosphate kinase regulator n=1 Tax=Solilutibacter oculi TaxID=2698682 RepID=UPI001C2DE1E2
MRHWPFRPCLRSTHLSTLPPILITRVDCDRLEALLDSRAVRSLPGLDALRVELERATVVEPREIPREVATMNSKVKFIEDASGKTFELTLVYPQQAGQPESISILAPVGSALLGLRVGQTIQWPMPGGKTSELRLLEVLEQPEAEGRDLG